MSQIKVKLFERIFGITEGDINLTPLTNNEAAEIDTFCH